MFFFSAVDDFTIEHIAGFLCDSYNLCFLAHFAQTCKHLNKICSRVISAYDEECEARFEDLGEDADGCERRIWKNERGEVHRWHDRPAIICKTGALYWCLNGKYWRKDDLPTEFNDGCYYWRSKDGIIHRNGDKPAMVCGVMRRWCSVDGIHRDGDKPAVIHANGSRFWFKSGIEHRDRDKPAAIFGDGTMVWFDGGTICRGLGKPAQISSDGKKTYIGHGEGIPHH